MNDIERTIVEWIQGDPALLAHLQGVARYEECGHGGDCAGPGGCAFDYGDTQLGCLVDDYVTDPTGPVWIADVGGDPSRVQALRNFLPDGWIEEVVWENVRAALLGETEKVSG